MYRYYSITDSMSRSSIVDRFTDPTSFTALTA